MGGNVRIDDAALRARAKEIQQQMSEVGIDLTTNPITDKKTGAIFTYKKDANGKLTCSYQYHNERQNDIILFKRTTVPTSSASLGYLSDEQFEEFKENHPGHFYTTEYAASDKSIERKDFAESNLNHYDKGTRKAAEKVYKETVANEFMASGTYDKKAANKLAKYAMNDAKAGLRAENRVVYMDKAEYENAKKILEYEQKAAKNRIKLYKKAGRPVPAEDEEILKKSVEYIKDKDVRKYVEAHKNRFYDENGKFSNTKYHEWAETHLQGDNTLTTSERKPGSITTGLSKGDMTKAVKYAGYDAQKDHTLKINLAKALVGIISGPLIAYMTNHNIHDIKELKDVITITADSADPSKYTVFVDGVSIAEARSEVIANFRDVAVRNAILSSVLATIFNNGLVDPAGARDRKAEGITAATISEQNIFRGKDVTDIQGDVTLEEGEGACDDDDETCKADLKKVTTDGEDKPEDVKYAKSYYKETNELSYWYDFVNAYNFDTKKYSIKDIYKAIQRRNGYTSKKPNPPLNVMLPLELTLPDGTVIASRKAEYEIPRHKRPTGKGNGLGNAPGGKPQVVNVPGTTEYRVFDCDGNIVPGKFNEKQARDKYKELTGKEYQGEIQE